MIDKHDTDHAPGPSLASDGITSENSTAESELRPDQIPPESLPAHIQGMVQAGECIYYAATPIRRAGGLGVWLIMCAGIAYVPASLGALAESIERYQPSESSVVATAFFVLLVFGCLLFFAFSAMLLCWPLLSEWHRRSSFVLITNRHVYKTLHMLNRQRVQTWPVSSCNEPSVARRRGKSATLVLKEHLDRRKTDDVIVYKWIAIHGLPNAEDALRALLFARQQAVSKVNALPVEDSIQPAD